jgi:gas vesicle protein
MNDAWIGVIIGGVIGFVATSIGATINGYFNRSNSQIQLHFQAQQDWNKLLLSRFEEIYELTFQVRKSCNEFDVSLMQLALSKKFNDWKSPEPPKTSRLCVLVEIYAPQLKGELTLIQHLISEYISTSQKWVISDTKEDHDKNFIELVKMPFKVKRCF